MNGVREEMSHQHQLIDFWLQRGLIDFFHQTHSVPALPVDWWSDPVPGHGKVDHVACKRAPAGSGEQSSKLVADAAIPAMVFDRALSPLGSTGGAMFAKAQHAAQPQTHLQVGRVLVKRLGSVVHDRPAYHTRHFIYPVGFLSERSYSSYCHPGTKTVYTCEVLDGGERPEFKITASDDVDNPIVAVDPTAAWRVVDQRVQAVLLSPADSRRQIVQHLRGAVYFGLAHPSVIRRLHELAGTKKCSEYLYNQKHRQLNDMGHSGDKPGPPSGNTAVAPTYPAALRSRSIGAERQGSRRHGWCETLSAADLGTAEKAVQVGDDATLAAVSCLLLGDSGPAALTVKQPWARALSWGVKDVENRGFQLRLPAHGQGRWLALHAGSCKELLSDASLLRQLAFNSGIAVEDWTDGIHDELGVILGAILITQVLGPDELKSVWAIPGMFGWRVGKFVRLSRPIAMSGQLGIWSLPPAIQLFLALHIRENWETSLPAHGARGARIVADHDGVRFHRIAEAQVAGDRGHESGVTDELPHRFPLPRTLWERLERRVCDALQALREREADAAARRRAKAARYQQARSCLAPGVAVSLHPSLLDQGTRSLNSCTQKRNVREAAEGRRRRACRLRRSGGAGPWVSLRLVCRRAGSEWLASTASDEPVRTTSNGSNGGSDDASFCVSVDLTCAAFERAWSISSSPCESAGLRQDAGCRSHTVSCARESATGVPPHDFINLGGPRNDAGCRPAFLSANVDFNVSVAHDPSLLACRPVSPQTPMRPPIPPGVPISPSACAAPIRQHPATCSNSPPHDQRRAISSPSGAVVQP